MRKTDQIIVTGSKGFIGRHLMKALGKHGRGYDHNINPMMDVNIAEVFHDYVRIVKPQAIVHLAAVSSAQKCKKDPEQAMRTNVVGTFNVLRIAKKYEIPVILASSAATAEPELSLYGTTKECMEVLANLFDNAIIARFYNVYGPGSKSVVNKFIKQILKGQTITLYGNTSRDYIYVDDVVESLLQLLSADEPPKIVEIGTGRVTSLMKLKSIIEKLTKKSVEIDSLPSLKEIQYSQCFERYGVYTTTLEQGIRRLLT